MLNSKSYGDFNCIGITRSVKLQLLNIAVEFDDADPKVVRARQNIILGEV